MSSIGRRCCARGSTIVIRRQFYPEHNTELQIRVVESTTHAMKVDVIWVEGSIVYGTARVWRTLQRFHLISSSHSYDPNFSSPPDTAVCNSSYSGFVGKRSFSLIAFDQPAARNCFQTMSYYPQPCGFAYLILHLPGAGYIN